MKQKHIAITGTKGKSTVTRIVQEICVQNEMSVYGEYGCDGKFFNGGIASLEKPLASTYFKSPFIKKSDVIVSEATSYCLDEDSYEDTQIDVAVFTSFEETEHREIHSTKEEYLSAKKKIFSYVKDEGVLIVNADIKDFDLVVDGIEGKVITYGSSENCDYKISRILCNLEETTFTITDPNGEDHFIKSNLLGSFNAHNIAAAFASCKEIGIDDKSIISAIEKFQGVMGRVNQYHVEETECTFVIDYAHTPESLANILSFFNEHKGEKDLICIFGCGGDKSKEKRILMGRIAEELCDKIVITNDNPRDEDPREIVKDILEGVGEKSKVRVCLDRQEAIKSTLSNSKNSIIVSAGKGAERQIRVMQYLLRASDLETFVSWSLQNGFTFSGNPDLLE